MLSPFFILTKAYKFLISVTIHLSSSLTFYFKKDQNKLKTSHFTKQTPKKDHSNYAQSFSRKVAKDTGQNIIKLQVQYEYRNKGVQW